MIPIAFPQPARNTPKKKNTMQTISNTSSPLDPNPKPPNPSQRAIQALPSSSPLDPRQRTTQAHPSTQTPSPKTLLPTINTTTRVPATCPRHKGNRQGATQAHPSTSGKGERKLTLRPQARGNASSPLDPRQRATQAHPSTPTPRCKRVPATCRACRALPGRARAGIGTAS